MDASIVAFSLPPRNSASGHAARSSRSAPARAPRGSPRRGHVGRGPEESSRARARPRLGVRTVVAKKTSSHDRRRVSRFFAVLSIVVDARRGRRRGPAAAAVRRSRGGAAGHVRVARAHAAAPAGLRFEGGIRSNTNYMATY